MKTRYVLQSLPMLYFSITLITTAVTASEDTPPVPSYADARATYEAGSKPGMLSEADRAVMQRSADELAGYLPDPV